MPADRSDEVPDWRAERSCPICWTNFQPVTSQHRFCSERCRKTTARRARAATELDVGSETAAAQRPGPVATRACPHCGHDVSIVALLTTPAAARPSVPELDPPSIFRLRRA